MTGAQTDVIWLLLGLVAFLTLASTIRFFLQQRIAPDGSNAVIENLNARINAWWVMIALMALALLCGRTGAGILFGLCSFAALREFISLLDTRRSDHWALAAAFFVVLPVQYYLIWIGWYGSAWPWSRVRPHLRALNHYGTERAVFFGQRCGYCCWVLQQQLSGVVRG